MGAARVVMLDCGIQTRGAQDRGIRRRAAKVMVHPLWRMDWRRRHEQGSRAVAGTLAETPLSEPSCRANLQRLQQELFR